jgi:nucleoside-diphosphate-sugar epimerase
MRLLLTGGAGDLGRVLVPKLLCHGYVPVILDIRAPAHLPPGAEFINGSILDRPKLPKFFAGCDYIVHIAAWHGIHESRGEKAVHDFFDLNVRGTFEVFEAAAALGINRIVYISTTSVYRPDTLYGRSKILAEQIAGDYARYRGMNVVTLRPRAFIPFWNRGVYSNFIDWALWFWRGAVHVDDVAAAVMLGIDHLSRAHVDARPALTLDGAYDYTDADLAHWDAGGAGSTFRKYYPDYYDLVLSHGLDPAVRPNKLDISETVRWLGYQPCYGMAQLLAELATYGDNGPPLADC